MLSNSASNIFSILKGMSLYDLTEKSSITAEILSYDAGFKIFETKLAELISSVFVQTSTGESLTKHENLVGLYPRLRSSLEKRRELVIHRLSITPNDFKVEKIGHSIFASGINGYIQEQRHRESITIFVKDIIDFSLNMEQIEESLKSLMPAHLEWSFNYGKLTFNILDSKDINWNRWNSEDFTWNEFDQNGENLFT